MAVPRLVWKTDRAPLAPQVADHLLAAPRGGILDLSETLLLLPTANAARRVREELARRAAAGGRALLAPITIPVGRFLQLAANPKCATAEEARVAWVRVLMESRAEDVEALCPAGPPSTTAAAAGLGEALIESLRLLAESGRSPADVLALGDVEPERWRCIASLAAAHSALLRRGGLESFESALARWVAAPELPAEIRRVIVAGVPDLSPAAARALERLSERDTPVEILTFAPGFEAAERAAFDTSGRPVPEFWTRRTLLADEAAVIVAGDSASLAELAMEALAAHATRGSTIGLIAPDPSLVPWLLRACERRRLTAFDPAGDPASRFSGAAFLRLTREAQSDPSIERIAALIRHPAVLARLAELAGSEREAILSEFDRLRADRLPVNLDAARALAGEDAPLGPVLAAIGALLAPGERAPGEQLRAWLGWAWPAGAAGLVDEEIEALRAQLGAWSELRITPPRGGDWTGRREHRARTDRAAVLLAPRAGDLRLARRPVGAGGPVACLRSARGLGAGAGPGTLVPARITAPPPWHARQCGTPRA